MHYSGSFWLTRIVFIRSLAFIYSVAFLVALDQNKQLLGKDGLLPVDAHLNDLKQRLGTDSVIQRILQVPTILWLVDFANINLYLDLLAFIGLALSFLIFITGAANMLAMALLWLLYHSIVNVGQRWYSFGWESQLLETGFLAIWLCPVIEWKQLPPDSPPSIVALIGNRWLIVRIMFGAGLIKIRGDQCWRDLTCMNYHYETQPVPNPLAWYMHQSPELMHKLEVLVNHFVELFAPLLIVVPTRTTIVCGGIVQVLFQVVLILSGNLSFLNWLTILPSLCCFDDRCYAALFSTKTKQCASSLASRPRKAGYYIRRLVDVSLFGVIAYLSIPVVQNLFSSRQMMNTSFEPLRLVNTYGAFGSITKERTEVIMQGTYHEDPTSSAAQWLEYEFKCKPGNVSRRPCVITPYHYRLDWLMWFAAFSNYQHHPWLVHLVAQLLRSENQNVTTLLELNPFAGKPPPRFIRLEHYRYRFSRSGSDAARRGQWWTRKRIGEYMPPVSLAQLRPMMRRTFGWKD